MSWLTDPQTWLSLFTLTVLEIVLGIDNIIFISILAGKLPEAKQSRARTIGLSLALITRVLLLCSIFWLSRLTGELFRVSGHGVSGKDLVMLSGGLFLICKSIHEIHNSVEGTDLLSGGGRGAGLIAVIAQIVLIDIVFSLDSVITAVGIGPDIKVMIGAVMLAMIVMLAAAGTISAYVNKHPTIKMLALSFLLLVGVVLIGDGIGQHVEKGYIYFAMAFSFCVEMLNLKMRANRREKPPEPDSP